MAVAYKRLELAEKLANGQFTLAEYQTQYLEFAAQANTQRQLRQNQAQVAQAAQQQANAAQQQANAAACMAARQKTANDNAAANAQAANGNNSPAANVAAAMAAIADGIDERRACNP